FFQLARLNVDGTLDTTFGAGGIVKTFFGDGVSGSTNAEARGVALQSDGKIVAGGNASVGGPLPRLALARYETDGGLDPTVGSAGMTTSSVGASGATAWAIALQPDGKIVTAGSVVLRGRTRFMVARYTGDGSLDTSFGTGGIAMPDLGA